MSIKEIIGLVIVFLFFVCGTVATLFFIIESCLCIFHAAHGGPLDAIEIVSLIIVSLVCGAAGLICYIDNVM